MITLFYKADSSLALMTKSQVNGCLAKFENTFTKNKYFYVFLIYLIIWFVFCFSASIVLITYSNKIDNQISITSNSIKIFKTIYLITLLLLIAFFIFNFLFVAFYIRNFYMCYN